VHAVHRGSELIRRASQGALPGLRQTCCITAYPMDAQLGLPLLPKPFSRKELLQRVRDALVRPTAIAV
jgi:hypothetical protein